MTDLLSPKTQPDSGKRVGAMVDAHGRTITYLRLSVTDRCDLRCRYCMAEQMTFLPRKALLTLEELAILADGFISRGIRRIRLTGGEPLVRRDLIDLANRIGRHLGHGLDELTLTTNGMLLDRYAEALADAGVRRINVSLDSRDPARFAHITRGGDLAKALVGIEAARAAGIAVKINMVAMQDVNSDEIEPMFAWCASEGHDLTLIETMPLGTVERDRATHFLPLGKIVESLSARFGLRPSTHRTGGPARYYEAEGLASRLGVITPLSHNFCATCNRMRMTCEGKIYMCLGHDDHVDLREALREGPPGAVDAALDRALATKPLAHDFQIDRATPAVARHMSVTGG